MRTLSDEELDQVVGGSGCYCGCPEVPVCNNANPGNDMCVGNAFKTGRKFVESPGNGDLSGSKGASN
jgi:bacteriocin-like protein